MKRRDFIKQSAKAMAFCMVPLPEFTYQEAYTQAQLLGKSNSLILNKSIVQKETYNAFLSLKNAAAKENINPQIVSGYRSYLRQQQIWNKKYNRYKAKGLSETAIIKNITQYSTFPGTSRHHWGTDIDIIDANAKRPKNLLLTENYYEDGPYNNLRLWMEEHAATYGFIMTYPNLTDRPGFLHEPWHFSYAPTAKKMLHQYTKLPLNNLLKNKKVLGADFFVENELPTYLKNYVLGIHKELL